MGEEYLVSRSIWLVTSRCTDPTREAEFNRWYDDVHVPDVLQVPHVVSAQRYKLAGPPHPAEPTVQYLVLYEIDADDPQAVWNTLLAEYWPKWQAARAMHETFEGLGMVSFTPVGVRQEATALPAGD